MLHPQTKHNNIIDVPDMDLEDVSVLTSPALCLCAGRKTDITQMKLMLLPFVLH